MSFPNNIDVKVLPSGRGRVKCTICEKSEMFRGYYTEPERVRAQIDEFVLDHVTCNVISIDIRDDGLFATTLINEESEGVWQGYLTQHEVTKRLLELNPTETLVIKFTPEKRL